MSTVPKPSETRRFARPGEGVESRMRVLQSHHEDLRLLVRQQHLALERLKESLAWVRLLAWTVLWGCGMVSLASLVVAVQSYQGG